MNLTEKTFEDERRRVDSELWKLMVSYLHNVQEDYDSGDAIHAVNHHKKLCRVNDELARDRKPSVGIGFYGTDSFTCSLRELRNMVPDAYPMLEVTSYEALLEADSRYEREMTE